MIGIHGLEQAPFQLCNTPLSESVQLGVSSACKSISSIQSHVGLSSCFSFLPRALPEALGAGSAWRNWCELGQRLKKPFLQGEESCEIRLPSPLFQKDRLQHFPQDSSAGPWRTETTLSTGGSSSVKCMLHFSCLSTPFLLFPDTTSKINNPCPGPCHRFFCQGNSNEDNHSKH